MKYKLWFVLSLIIFTASGLVAQTDTEGTLNHGGRERTYTVHVPASYTGETSVPLVIGLHGGGGNGSSFARMSNFDTAADAHGFIVVYPDGIGNGWNDGRTAFLQQAILQGIDDVGFLDALIDTITTQYNIDRVYMAGFASGGMMTFRFACALADRLDGFMTVAASMPDPVYESCVPDQPLHALIIVGEADPVIPFEGGEVGLGRRHGDVGSVVSAIQTRDFWAAVNGCEFSHENPILHGANDGAQAFIDMCDGYNTALGAGIYFIRIENGGHGYPGDESPQSDVLGIVTQDFSATGMFVRYFFEIIANW